MISATEVSNRNERSVEPDAPGWEYTPKGMIYFQHVFAYELALAHCKRARVLDIGCGSGYGARMLGKEAESVTGIDLSHEAIAWANQHNDQPNVQYLCADIHDPSLAQEQFDVITVFQVIEHIPAAELARVLHKLGRLLAPNGVAFITTPNRLRRIPLLQAPFNPHHVKEYAPWALTKLLTQYFGEVKLQYICGNEHVLAAEWDRGTRVTPLRYYGTGMVAGAAGRVVAAPFFASRRWQSEISRFFALTERRVMHYMTPRPVLRWDQSRPFGVGDFYLTSEFNWWAIDLFAEIRKPKKEL